MTGRFVRLENLALLVGSFLCEISVALTYPA